MTTDDTYRRPLTLLPKNTSHSIPHTRRHTQFARGGRPLLLVLRNERIVSRKLDEELIQPTEEHLLILVREVHPVDRVCARLRAWD